MSATSSSEPRFARYGDFDGDDGEDYLIGDHNVSFGIEREELDVFNLFDQSAVTEVNEYAEQDSISPPNYVANPNYKLPTHYQSPRAVRFGVGLNF